MQTARSVRMALVLGVLAVVVLALLVPLAVHNIHKKLDDLGAHPPPQSRRRYYREATKIPPSSIASVADRVRRATGEADPKLQYLSVRLWVVDRTPGNRVEALAALGGAAAPTDLYTAGTAGPVRRLAWPEEVRGFSSDSKRSIEQAFHGFRYSEVPWASLPAIVDTARSACRGAAPRADVALLEVHHLAGEPVTLVYVLVIDPDTGRHSDQLYSLDGLQRDHGVAARSPSCPLAD